jgi:SAM-dependent methyltransferase
MGLKISRILDSPIDFFLACDAENIPFEDEFFDSIIMLTAMHHLPHPEKMLKEVKRVLKKGGIFIVVDGAIPKWFKFLFRKEAEERAKKHGIIENLISFGEWETILKEGGMSKSNLTPYTNPKYVEGFIHRLGASILNRLPKRFVKHVFPVGIVIRYTKK